MEFGCLNFTEKHSRQYVTEELGLIWEYVASEKLKLPRTERVGYGVILVVPDRCQAVDIVEMVNILLLRVNFGFVLIHQESIMATFGAGVPSACVVDIGYDRTSICCVDEGIVVPKTRY